MIEPVITKESLFQQIRLKVEEITDTFYQLDYKDMDPGLMAGKAGIALFLAYHSKIFRCEESAELAVSLVDSIIEDINTKNEVFTFSDGLAGIGWLILHLQRHRMIEYDEDNELVVMDRTLSQFMNRDLWNRNYDLLHGGIGYGMYFLERFFQNHDPQYLDQAVIKLESTFEYEQEKGCRWETDIHLEELVHGVNLGMAHGMPSIIAFLSKVHQFGAEDIDTSAMILGACSYLIQCRHDEGHCRSCYPGWISEGSPAGSRLAWCYGDPGVGLAFLHAEEALAFKTWEKEYRRIFKINAGRRSLEDDFVFDAGLCHGTSGLAQIFNRIYQKTKEDLFLETSGYWIRKTLEMSKHRDGLAGYKAYRSSKYGNWAREPGLLEGIAGIGLALMTSISNEDSKWDECLLIK